MWDQHPTRRKQQGRGPAGRAGGRPGGQSPRGSGEQSGGTGLQRTRRAEAEREGPRVPARATTSSHAQEDGREDRAALGDGRPLRGRR